MRHHEESQRSENLPASMRESVNSEQNLIQMPLFKAGEKRRFLDLTDYIFVVLLIVHVLAIVGWMGAALLFVSVLGPSLTGMDPSGRREFLSKVIPRYIRYVGATAGTAVVFGVVLYLYAASTKILPSGAALNLLQVGAATGLIAVVVALVLVVPSARNLVRMIGQMQTNSPPIEGQGNALVAQQNRVKMGSIAVVALLLLVLVLMVAGSI